MLEIRAAVEAICAERRAQGKEWGTLGYMVGEDWGDAATINAGVFKNGGLLSAFDFDGKKRLSGPMQDVTSEGLENGWDDVIQVLRTPRERGYCTDSVMPNLFLTNHDGYRLADHFDLTDKYYYEKQITRFAALAAYNGPITVYYGDEYADRTLETTGGQPDNVARTSGHLNARNEGEQMLHDYVQSLLKMRNANPAMWRGESSFTKLRADDADVLIVNKRDVKTDNEVILIFSDKGADVRVPNLGNVQAKAWLPVVIIVK